MINISYDKEADVLYVKFSLTTKAVKNDAMDEDGLILLGYDKNQAVVTLTVIDASNLVHKTE